MFSNISHVFEIFLAEMSAYAQPTHLIFVTVKSITSFSAYQKRNLLVLRRRTFPINQGSSDAGFPSARHRFQNFFAGTEFSKF